jgi:hypothetical protein
MICGDPSIGTGTVSLISRRRSSLLRGGISTGTGTALARSLSELERFQSTYSEECAQRCACGCFGLVFPTPIGGRRYVCMNCHLTYHGNCKSRTDPRY